MNGRNPDDREVEIDDEPECECYDGTNPDCPVHGWAAKAAARRERRNLDLDEQERDHGH